MGIRAFSAAGFSNWYLYKPLKILFDCGEACGMHLKGAMNVRNIFITHGHPDHFSGLDIIIWYRLLSSKADPLFIYYPKDDPGIINYINYVEIQHKLSSYKGVFNFIPLSAMDSVAINDKISVEAFGVEHEEGASSLGYSIIETRKKLKDEYAAADKSLIKTIIEKEGEAAYNIVRQKLLCYTGDCRIVNIDHIKKCDALIIDSTFLDAKDSGKVSHLTCEEAIKTGRDCGAKAIYLTHISRRYDKAQIDKTVESLKCEGLEIKVIYPATDFED